MVGIEEWKDVVGYEGRYMVSNFGNVKSLNYNRTGKERVLKPKIDKDGYHEYCLSLNGKTKYMRGHRLVAIAFIPNPNDLPQINHIDENRQNNSVENLEWCTLEYNIRYGSHMDNIKSNHAKGSRHQNSKRILCDKIIFDTVGECAEYLGVKYGTLKDWINPNRYGKVPDWILEKGFEVLQ